MAAGTQARIELIAVPGIPLVRPGDDLAALVVAALAAAGLALQPHDIVVFAQKVVSKAEGRIVDLSGIAPSPQAVELARAGGKDPRLVELVLSESKRIVRHRGEVLITEHRSGFVMANAGVDQSNVGGRDGDGVALLLPEDADASARRLSEALSRHFGCPVATIVSDSFGRPWRRGTVGVAIGCAGLPALRDLRGMPDLFGRPLQVTEVAYADEIAAAASLLMGQADEGHPAVIVRGLPPAGAPAPAATLVRPAETDLFR